MSIKDEAIAQAYIDLPGATAKEAGSYAGKLVRARYKTLVEPIVNAKHEYMYQMQFPHTLDDLRELDRFDNQIRELQINLNCNIFEDTDRPQLERLLLAVQRVFPGESRFDTALRYIREAESKHSISSGASMP